jgi:hypothetical protein
MISNEGAGRLGVLWAIYGVTRLAAALFLALFSGTATVMFGALLSRVPNPFALMSDFHFMYVVIIAWNIALGIISLVAAADLLARRGSARKVTILAGFLALPEMPFGGMLGVYTLIVLLRSKGRSP